MNFQQKIKTLPLTSGVYLMKDKDAKVIYVGKAVSLRKRVQSYFRKTSDSFKTDLLVKDIAAIDYLETSSEAEALILEASLIKQYQPKYNVDLRDDKSYPYIHISQEEFPRVSVVRPEQKRTPRETGLYYGPYVNASLIREALTIIRKIFHFRTCHPFPDKACLDYHIGICDAPCIQNISRKDYARNIRHVRWILEGKKDNLYKSLKGEMEVLVKEKRYEEAAKIRDQIRAIGALYSGTKDINYFKEAEQLQRVLGLANRPERIEAFDISNIMGHQAAGSMVSFLNGKPDKSNYRRFRIRHVEGIDDFKMMAEIVHRRYRRIKQEGSIFPDLIVIDGGKGQLSAALEQLDELEVMVPIISIAKKQEEIFLPKRKNPIVIQKDSLGLRLLQRIRDEAHRFAVSYHRKLRSKNVFEEE